MSEDRLAELEAKLGILDKIVKLGWALICGAFMIGCWVSILEIRSRAMSVQVERLTGNMEQVNLWKAEANGNRYTSPDHNRYAAEVQTTMNIADKRITRLEDSSVEIKKALDRIEVKLQTVK